jgi:hypothetical protein
MAPIRPAAPPIPGISSPDRDRSWPANHEHPVEDVARQRGLRPLGLRMPRTEPASDEALVHGSKSASGSPAEWSHLPIGIDAGLSISSIRLSTLQASAASAR